jgi:hypothetical protein
VGSAIEEPKMARNTAQRRQIVIFFRQLSWISPWQTVPLMNQQRFPTRNSQAGQFRFVSAEHFLAFQHGFALSGGHAFTAARKRAWRSTCAGIFLQPCSKL